MIISSYNAARDTSLYRSKIKEAMNSHVKAQKSDIGKGIQFFIKPCKTIDIWVTDFLSCVAR